MKTPTRDSVAILPICLLLIASVACGDDSAPAGGAGAGGASGGGGQAQGGAPPGGADEFCEDVVARDVECAVEDPTTTSACLADELTICLFGGIRDGVRETIIECVLGRPCAAMDDLEGCVYTPGEADPAPGQVEFKMACLTVQQDCGTFTDDLCGINFFETPAYEELTLCLEETCDLVGSCLEQKTSDICAG